MPPPCDPVDHQRRCGAGGTSRRGGRPCRSGRSAFAHARARLGEDALIGVSCYDRLDLALAAADEGADYVAFGAFFPPDQTRRDPRTHRVAASGAGGVTRTGRRHRRHHAGQRALLLETGADMLAVVSGVFGQPTSRPPPAATPPCSPGGAPWPPVPKSCSSKRKITFQRRQLAGPRLSRRRRHADLLQARRGRLSGHDEDGRRYIDYVGSWGPMIVGHAHPAVVQAVQDAAANGLSFGAPTEMETIMARRIRELVPSMELVRMCNSGTEATMSAIRLARGFTGRNIIVKFEGCYHGHSDSLLIKAGSGALTLGVPTSPGVPAALAAYTVTLTYNDLLEAGEAFSKLGGNRRVIVEPVAGNMNCIPRPRFPGGTARTVHPLR